MNEPRRRVLVPSDTGEDPARYGDGSLNRVAGGYKTLYYNGELITQNTVISVNDRRMSNIYYTDTFNKLASTSGGKWTYIKNSTTQLLNALWTNHETRSQPIFYTQKYTWDPIAGERTIGIKVWFGGYGMGYDLGAFYITMNGVRMTLQTAINNQCIWPLVIIYGKGYNGSYGRTMLTNLLDGGNLGGSISGGSWYYGEWMVMFMTRGNNVCTSFEFNMYYESLSGGSWVDCDSGTFYNVPKENATITVLP